MTFLYDNLISALVLGTMTLIIVSVQARTIGGTVSETSRHIAVKQAKHASNWLEEDLKTAGRNMDAGAWPFEKPDKVASAQSPSDSMTTQFAFHQTVTGPSGTPRTVTTTYAVQPADTVQVGGTATTTYTLFRTHDGAPDGSIDASLLYFDVDLLNANGVPAPDPSSPDDVRSLRVRFAIASPIQNADTLPQAIHRSVIVRPAHAD